VRLARVSRYGSPPPAAARPRVALLLDVSRTANVVATTDTSLYTLGKEAFVTSVTGHPLSAGEAARLIHERVPAQ
jgi:CRP-like cAMP-binding protein